MSYWFDAASGRREGVAGPTLWLAIALSLLVHLAALLWLPRIRPPVPGMVGPELAAERLQVEIAALAKPAPMQAPEAPGEVATPKPPARRARAVPRVQPPPVRIAPTPAAPALPGPPVAVTPVPAPPVPTPPASRPQEGDLSSYIQARRRERGEPPGITGLGQPTDLSGQLAANLPSPATGVAARERQGGGGLFEIRRMSYDDAAFEFFGWNDDMGRQTPQLIEVRLGTNSDMRIAVVRRMIAIIREHTKADFVWRSARRENSVTLSARLSDNVALEAFLLRDLFDDTRQAAGPPQSRPAQ